MKGSLKNQVGLVTAMEDSLATLRGLCKVFIGRWEEETPGTPGSARGHRTSPGSAVAMDIICWILCVPRTDLATF